jgi:hypothetical protein
MRSFTHDAPRWVPLVANSHVLCAAEVIERLAAAWVGIGQHTLIVDAAANAPALPAAAALGLSACIQNLSPQLSYLPAGGMVRAHVDTLGSAVRMLTEIQRAAPDADTVIVHAEAADLARIFKQQMAQPVLMAVDDPESLKRAYAGWKLLGQRCGWLSASLIVAQTPADRAEHMAHSLATCAEQFLNADLLSWAAIELGDEGLLGNTHSLAQLAAAHSFQNTNFHHGV